ncbi:transposase [Methylolobus aquaticus]
MGERPGAISGLMQSVGRRYRRYADVAYRRSGTLIDGRFKSSSVDSERYLLRCMRYIELNPVRAGLVASPGDLHWSSYRTQAGDAAIYWLTEPKEYRRLAASSEACEPAYRALFKQPLAARDLGGIRAHLNKDCALGSSKFQEEIEAMAGRHARIVPRGGRPMKPKDGAEK